jgi:hypothetical protein
MVMRVIVLRNPNASPLGATATQSAAAAHEVNLTTTVTRSITLGACTNGTNSTMAAVGQTAFYDNVVDNTNICAYGTFTGGVTSTTSTELLGTNGSFQGGCAAAEFKPLSGDFLYQDSSAPPSKSTTSATALTTASFSPPAGSLLVCLVSANGSFGNAVSMAITDSQSLSWTAAAQADAVTMCYAGVFYAVVPAVGTPYALGHTTSTSSTNQVSLTVSATSGLGDAIIVGISEAVTANAIAGVNDSQGNTYLPVATQTSTGVRAAMWVALNCAVLTNGTGVIVVTFGAAAATAKGIAAFGCKGVANAAAVDAIPTPTTGTSTSPSITSGTLVQAPEVVIALEANVAAGGAITWSGSPGATIAGFQAGSGQFTSMAGFAAAAVTSTAYHGTITSSAWAMVMVSLTPVPIETQFTMVPTYIYPFGAGATAWNTLIGGAPTTGLMIANVNSGPGVIVDANYAVVIPAAINAGITLCGYVFTSFGNRPVSAIEADIDTWFTLYGVRSIFFDEVNGAASFDTYYTTIVDYVHGASAGSVVVLNPGVVPDETFFTSVISAQDKIIVCENTQAGFPGDIAAAPSWLLTTPASQICVTINTCSSPSDMVSDINAARNFFNAQYVYITYDILYGVLPSYYSTEVAYLASGAPAFGGTSPAVGVTLAGHNGHGTQVGFVVPSPPQYPLQVGVTNVAGDWMVAVIGLRQDQGWWSGATTGTPSANNYFTLSTGSSVYATIQVAQTFTDVLNPGQVFTVASIGPAAAGQANIYFTPDAGVAMTSDTVTQTGTTVTVADDAHNWWFPVGAPTITTTAAGVTRTTIWAAPAARAATYVSVVPTDSYMALGAVIYDVSGISPFAAVGPVFSLGQSSPALSLSVPLGAPPDGQAIIITGSTSDSVSNIPTLADGGWLNQVAQLADNGVDATSDLVVYGATQVTTGATNASWATTAAVDWSGASVAIYVSGSSPVISGNPNWPYVAHELVLDTGPGVPADQITWSQFNELDSVRSRVLMTQMTQGKQYMLDQLQTGQGQVTLDDPDQALIPPGSGDFAGIDSGTPYRTRMMWAGGSWSVQWSGDGVTAFPQLDTGASIPADPGTNYTASAWLACSTDYGSGVYVNLLFFSSSFAFLADNVGSMVTTPVAGLSTVSGIAPPTTAWCAVVIQAGGTPASSLVFYAQAAYPVPQPSLGADAYVAIPSAASFTAENGATLDVLNPWAYSRTGPPVATPWFIPLAGYFQRWPPSWDANTYRGQSQATTADIWAYANRQLKSSLREEQLTDHPYAYWPLADAEEDINLRSTTGASNYAPGNTNVLNVTLSKNGNNNGQAAQAFGQNADGLPGDQVTTITTSSRTSASPGMWGQTFSSAGSSNTIGYCLQVQDTNFPPITTGVTISCFFQMTAATPPVDGTIFGLCNNTQRVLKMDLDSATGHLLLVWFDQTGAGTTVTIESSFDLRNTSTPSHCAISFDQNSYTAYFDGGAIVATGTFSSPLPPTFEYFSVGGIANPVATEGFYAGFSGHASVYGYIVPSVRILSWYYSGKFNFAAGGNGQQPDGESDDTRVSRLLGYSGIVAPKMILQGLINPVNPEQSKVVSMQDIGGQPAATAVTNIAASTVPSLLYISPNGDINYWQKSYVYNLPISWVLGDNVAAGEIPFGNDYSPDYDPARVVNDIALTQLDDQSVTVPDDSVLEQMSQNSYGDQTYQATAYLQADALSAYELGPTVADLANFIAEVNALPRLRVASVTVNAASQPAAWPFVAGASVGDMVVVNLRMPTASAQLVSITGRITQTNRNFQFDATALVATLTALVDLAPEDSALTVDDPILGQLNGINILAW